MDNEFIQKFGYTEMYEWEDTQNIPNRLGVFVQFSEKVPNKIRPYENGELIGVTSVNSLSISDDPDNWKYANMCNEVGDLFLQKERLAVGQKVYDEVLEFNYIMTRPWEHFITVPNKDYDQSKQYVKRSNRPEWVKVSLMGKTIVRDNGECQPGGYCKPYVGKIIHKFGTAIPAIKGEPNSFYVMERLTEKTILVLLR